MKIISKAINFLKEVKMQLIKVSWPTKQELIGATAVVIVVTILIGIYIYIVDTSLAGVLSWVFR